MFHFFPGKNRHGELSKNYTEDKKSEEEQLSEHHDIQDEGIDRVVHVTVGGEKKEKIHITTGN